MGDDGALRLWDAVTGASVGADGPHGAPISAVCFSPDGARVATASRAGVPCLWDGATGRPIGGPAPWPGEPGASILSMAFHPDGNRLAVHLTGPTGPEIAVIDLATGKVVAHVKLKPR